MKIVKFIAIIFLSLSSTFAFASIKIANSQNVKIYYTLDDKSKTATVNPCENGEYMGTITIPATVTHNGRSYEVTKIASKAFFKCKNLLEITIPEYITEIGGLAFKGCDKLKIVNFNAVNCISAADKAKSQVSSAFEDCKSITAINFGASVTNIPEYTFWGCTGVSSVTIPERVQSIGGAAFIDCSSISKVTLNAIRCVSMYSNIDGRIIPAFIGAPITTIEFGPMATTIPDYAFFGCKTLREVTIPEGITMIGGGAFRMCNSLTTVNFNAKNCTVANTIMGENNMPAFNNDAINRVTFGKSVKNIPNYLFWGCKGLSSIEFNDRIETIGMSSFYGCMSLNEITIPESVQSIGGNAFAGCKNLHTINFNAINCVNMVTVLNNVPTSAFDRKGIHIVNFGNHVENIPDYAFSECEKIKDFNIPESVKSIGYRAFYGCKSLQSITIPTNVKSIGGQAFVKCTSLTNVIFNAKHCVNASSLEKENHFSAFNDCRSIRTVIISDSVEVIPDYIFNGCSNLTSITIPKNVTSIGNNSFNNCNNLSTVVYNAAACKETTAFNFLNISDISLGENVQAIPNNLFLGCSRLDHLTLPKTVEAIGKYAFKDCTGLKELTIPENISIIEGGAFEGCRNLQIIHYNAINSLAIVSYEEDAEIVPVFQNARVHQVVFGNKVEAIPSYLFYNCNYLEDITLNKGLKTIGEYAFAYSNLLKSITIPEGVTKIGGGSFKDCKQLSEIKFNATHCISAALFKGDSIIYPFVGKNHIEKVTFGNKVQSIPEGLFHNCKYLSEIVLPKNLKSIGGLAFSNCPKLVTVVFNSPQCMNTHSTIKNIEYGPFENCERLSEVILSNKLTRIPDYLLKNCINIKKITIPEKVKSIGSYAFYNCIDIKRLTLPKALTTIEDHAFERCGITGIYIGEFLSEIGEDAFKKCISLSSIRIKKQNKFFKVEGGILYTYNKDKVVLEPAR